MSKNKTFIANEIIKQISDLSKMFTITRLRFPYIPPGLINSELLSDNTQKLNNQIAHFLNQNFLIRVFSLLQYYGVYDNFNKKDNCELYILKRFRNKFGHTLGSYNKDNEDDRNLMRHIIRTFKLEDKEYSDFPIPSDTVIKNIIESAIQYVKERYP